MEKLNWNGAYQIKVLEEGMVFLLSEFDFVLLKGKAYSQLAPLLAEGKYSEDELIDCLTSQTPAEMLYYALERLKRQNLISQRCHHVLEDLRAFCGLLCIPENIAAEALNSTKVSITSLISPACTEFTSLLNAYQVQIVDSPEEAQIAVLIVEDYLAQGIDDFCRMRKDKPWMLLRASGAQAWVGPFFEPGKTGCYGCLAKRLKQNRQEDAFFLGEETLTLPSQAKLPSARLAAWNLAATELLKRILLGKSESLEGKILIFDPLRPKLESHRIPQLFSCPECGREKFQSTGNSLCLQSRNKKDHSGDGYRINSPEETLQQYAHLVSPVTGIVKYLERVAHPIGSAAHVYISGTNWALPNSLKFKTISSFRNHCSGKGTTDAVAKAGALCEALERFSGIYNEKDIVQHAAFHDMKGSAIHPNQILLISDSQYANRTAINSQAHRFASISDPFPEDKALAWSPVYSLTEKKIKHLPTALCYYNYKDPHWNNMADSNGCAAGNCLEEAILQGFLELVERDSVAIWWYNRLPRPAVDLDSFSLPFISTLQNEYKKVNRELWALDITTDFGIPTFAAISKINDGGEEMILFGFGAHFDAKVALLRAFTELNQITSNSSFWEETDTVHDKQEQTDKEILRNWLKNATVENQPYLRKNGPLKEAKEYLPWESSDLLEEILRCQKMVEELGMEFLVLDQTRPDIGLSVVRVIVPGLRHFWTRFAPGRLYDVPVKMGWLSKPTAESELNPISMFL